MQCEMDQNAGANIVEEVHDVQYTHGVKIS